MQTSENINEIAGALAKAQGEITGALKDSANPFFKSKYADLASCWDACRGPLTKYGLAVFQTAEAENNGSGMVSLTTMIAHSSGQWVKGTLMVHPKDDTPQAVGSAFTYARRYALTAMVGVAQVDDDGNAASGRQPAYAEPITPKGDMGKSVKFDDAERAAISMREILESDVEEDVKVLHVADRHDFLNRDENLYVAAAERLKAAERSSWKAYVAMAKKRAAAEPTAANGRR